MVARTFIIANFYFRLFGPPPNPFSPPCALGFRKARVRTDGIGPIGSLYTGNTRFFYLSA